MKPGQQITIKLKTGEVVERAEVVHVPENGGQYQFLDLSSMKVIETDSFEVIKNYVPKCACINPAAAPHPNGKDIICNICNKTIKI